MYFSTEMMHSNEFLLTVQPGILTLCERVLFFQAPSSILNQIKNSRIQCSVEIIGDSFDATDSYWFVGIV